jgi:hypothetical protein
MSLKLTFTSASFGRHARLVHLYMFPLDKMKRVFGRFFFIVSTSLTF